MTRAARWAVGLGASTIVHVAGAGVLLAALTPDPVPVQPAPTSRLDMQAMALQRESAQQAEPRQGIARESDAEGTTIPAGAVSTSRADAVAPPTDTAVATDGPTQTAPAATPTLSTVAPASASPSQAQASTPAPERASLAAPMSAPVAASALTASALTDAPPSAQVAMAGVAQPSAVLPAQPRAEPAQLQTARPIAAAALEPSAQSAQLAEAPATVAQPATPQPAALPNAPVASTPAIATDPDHTRSEAATPQGARVTAQLAFAGADGDVDPVSLAAFQAFMQPGEATAQGDPLRDGVAALLAAVPCSRLQVSFDPETTTLQLKGHIPEDGLRAPVLAALQAQMGPDIAVSDSLRLLPRPQCGALSGIASVGLPQSTDQTTNPLLIGEDTHARALDFVRDDRLWFDITGPDYPAFVYVDFFDAGGNVIHLAPNPQVPLAELAPKAAYRVGSREEGDVGLTLLVGPPYGQEIAVAFAASAPLYDGLRPMVEPAAPYLDWLRSRVQAARAADPEFKGEWVYFFVSTSEG